MIPLIPMLTRVGAMMLAKKYAKDKLRKKILKDAALKKKVDKIGKKAAKKEAKKKEKKDKKPEKKQELRMIKRSTDKPKRSWRPEGKPIDTLPLDMRDQGLGKRTRKKAARDIKKIRAEGRSKTQRIQRYLDEHSGTEGIEGAFRKYKEDKYALEDELDVIKKMGKKRKRDKDR